jgi:hypothetical protein
MTDKDKHKNGCFLDFYCSNRSGKCRYWERGVDDCNHLVFSNVCASKVAQINSAALFLKRELGVDNVKKFLEEQEE